MKKLLAIILMLTTIFATTAVYANFNDVPKDEKYSDAVDRLNALDIMKGNSSEEFNPNGLVTRAQFSAVIVKASGLKETAETMKGSSVYSDVDPSSDFSGYISVAVNKGFIAGLLDSKFQPDDNITYAQVCTAVVKALGYTDKDVQGLWPKSYIEKASKLELTEGFNLKYNDAVPRWALAVIIDRLLDTDIKTSSAAEQAKSFADSVGLYTECIILANSATSDKLADNQVLTDKGIFYVGDSEISLELGNTYRLDIKDNDTIKAAYGKQRTLENISVDSSVGNKVIYKNAKNDEVSKVLPDKTVYYYQGTKINYDNIKEKLQTRSSIVFAYNKSKSGYEYAVIFDPIYSKPEVARSFDPSSRQLGSISIPSNSTVIREGKVSDVLHIREKDVVYSVTDIWNKDFYLQVISDRIGGKISDVLPDRVTPKVLKINDKEYSISQDINISNLKVRPGSLEKDDNIVALLGRDGKIVELEYPGSENNSNYALVLNTHAKIASDNSTKLSVTYSVKLLTADGVTATYECQNDPSQLKGRLVKYKWVDRQKVSVEFLTYNYPKGVVIDKGGRTINSDYASDNIKVFNIVSEEEGADVEANLIDFDDFPAGTLQNNKVYFMEKSGPFNDINVMVTNDLNEEKYKVGVLKSQAIGSDGTKFQFSSTILVEGKEYFYGEAIGNSEVGAVTNVKITQGKIVSADNARKAEVKGNSVDAYDTRRIKVNGKVYKLKNNVTVYFTDYQGNVKFKSLADVKIDEFYGSVSLYFDDNIDNGGKVEVIVVKQ